MARYFLLALVVLASITAHLSSTQLVLASKGIDQNTGGDKAADSGKKASKSKKEKTYSPGGTKPTPNKGGKKAKKSSPSATPTPTPQP